jgi:ferric-dicitrate binding protein FerR (iron transport regulator)
MNIKQILDSYKKQGFTLDNAKTFLDLTKNPENEKIVKENLLEELINIKTNKIDVDRINFRTIYGKIKKHIFVNNLPDKSWLSRPYLHILRIAAVFVIAFLIGGAVTYSLIKQPTLFSENQTEINTPLASKSTVTLPDGSVVILNAGSKIIYDNLFNINNRQLTLDGEAFFKVTENKKIPFVVLTSHVNIKALGTEFNVKAYSDEKVIVTTLVKGKVEIRKKTQLRDNSIAILLQPNQKALYIKEQEKFDIEANREVEEVLSLVPLPKEDTMYVFREVDTRPAIVWTENKMILQKESLASLAVKLERKYDVVIRFADEDIKHFRFSGTLLDETIQQVLDAIMLSSPIRYSIEGKVITIYENLSMKERFREHLKQLK